MALRTKLFLALAAALAALCIRLGVWQLDRRTERRARNATVVARAGNAVGDLSAIPRDPDSARYRRVRFSGIPDYEHELVVAGRSNRGSPGVHLVTPVRLAGSDSAVLVLRGWAYAPDAMTVDRARWSESDTSFSGFVLAYEPGPPKAILSGRPRTIQRMQRTVVDSLMPYPVLPFYVVATGDSAVAASGERIVRVGVPPLDDGPHLGYAIQWFGFALVAVVGAVVVAARSMQGRAGQGGYT